VNTGAPSLFLSFPNPLYSSFFPCRGFRENGKRKNGKMEKKKMGTRVQSEIRKMGGYG
jgi:hypothetical protein